MPIGRSSVPTRPPSAWETGLDEDGPLARAARLWTAWPDVIADPDQRDADGRLWTTADDILPGTTVAPGTRLVAAWGDVTFTATPRWDQTAALLLWLDQPANLAGRPEPARAMGAANGPHRTPGDTAAPPADSAGTTSVARAACDTTKPAPHEDPQDLRLCVTILAEAIARDRRAVREALEQLETLSEKHYQRLARDRSIQNLYSIARHPRGRA